MAIINQIVAGGTTYDLVDAGARSLISGLESYTNFLGVTTTAVTDGSTTQTVTINGESVQAKRGEIVTKDSKEFIWNGSAWQEFGDLSDLGDLAMENSVVATYTPQGSVSTPDITVTPTTDTVNAIDSAGTLPTATIPTFTVDNGVLTITAGSFNAGALPTTTSVSVLTGASAALDNAPVFTGTQETITSTKANV